MARGVCLVLTGMGGHGAGGFADVPFDRMQPITAVADMCGANVFACGKKIFDAFGNERTERNLKRERADVDVVGAARGGMQIDAIAADADAVRESLQRRRRRRKKRLMRCASPCRRAVRGR